MSNTDDLRALMDELADSSCKWCHVLTADLDAHQSVCLMRPDEDLPHELRRIIIRERYGRPGRRHLWGLW